MRLVLLALALALASPAVAQHRAGREQWQPEIADIDPRLAQPVEIEILGRAAVPALEILSEATGVSLAVAPEDLATVGERKLTIISKGLALKAIMVQIPEALQECHWDVDESEDEPVYLLHRNAGAEASVEQEREARRAKFEAQRRQQRLDSINDARRVLAMSPEELEKLEETDLFLARAARHPLWRELIEVYASVPEEYVSELVETGHLELRGDQPLSSLEAVRLCLRLLRRYAQWALSRPGEDRPPYWEELTSFQQQLQNWQDRIAPGASCDVKARIEDDRGRECDWGTVLQWETDQLHSFPCPLIPPRYTTIASSGSPYEWLLVETGDTVEDARRAVEDSEEDYLKLIEERQWSESDWVEPSDPRLHKQLEIPGAEGKKHVLVLELQRFVASETGLSIISDYFTGVGAGIYPGQAPLGDALWRDLYILGQSGNFKWLLVGDCLVFHHTMWHRLAQRELPESLIMKYRERLARQGHFTLNDATEFAGDIEGRLGSRQPFGAAIPDDLNKAGLGQERRYGVWSPLLNYGVSSPLLFYASLTPAEQARARSPDGLPLAELFAKGRRDLLRYVPVSTGNQDESVWRELARSARFSLTESAGEAEGAACTEYVFTFTFPEDADVSSHVVSSTVRLPEIAPTAQTDSDRGGSEDQVGDP